jgi:FkbM family methyltransferase
MQLLKRLIIGGLNAAGFEVHRVYRREQPHKFAPTEQDKDRWLQELGIRTVLDVGANTGQFAKSIRSTLPDAAIYSFEPLRDCYVQLTAAMNDAASFQAFNFALGDETGEQTINRSSFSPSSSLLPMSAISKEAFPFTDEGWTAERILVRRLDDVVKQLDLAPEVLIKIDVQGFEDRVIKGGWRTVQDAKIIITELSFQPLYDGQPLFDEIYGLLRAAGFRYGGAVGQLCNPNDGTPLQADGIFVRP